MAEDKPILHIDDDWKRQAQEEKARLEEEERKRRESQQQAPAMPMGAVASVTAPGAAPPGAAAAKGEGKRGRELPPASIQTLIHSMVTQTLFYLGDLQSRGGDSLMNMDMAKHQLDTLATLEEKTKGNLTPEEQEYFDLALYETRMRFISVAAQIISGA